MKARWCLIALPLFWACEPKYQGFDALDEEVHFKLLEFGERQRSAAKADFIELRCTSGLLRDSVPDYDVQLTLQKVAPEALAGAITGARILALHPGDSAAIRLPYHRFKESLLDEYCVDSLPIPDTTWMELHVRIVDAWSRQEYEALMQAEVQAGREEEDTFLREVLRQRRMLDTLEFVDGVYYRVLSRLPESVALVEGTPLELDRIGTLLDSTEFENSYTSRSTMFFKLGDSDQVLPGVERVLERLHYDDRAWCVMPSYLAFGYRGSTDGTVPGYTPVCFFLEVKFPREANLNTTSAVSDVDPTR